MKRLVVSLFSNTIYYATVNEKNHKMSDRDRKDMTDECVRAVFEWFTNHMEDESLKEYSITFPPSNFELVMREKNQEEKNR